MMTTVSRQREIVENKTPPENAFGRHGEVGATDVVADCQVTHDVAAALELSV